MTVQRKILIPALGIELNYAQREVLKLMVISLYTELMCWGNLEEEHGSAINKARKQHFKFKNNILPIFWRESKQTSKMVSTPCFSFSSLRVHLQFLDVPVGKVA